MQGPVQAPTQMLAVRHTGAAQSHARGRGSMPRQHGMGFGTVMILLVLVVFFVNAAIVTLPSYAAFWQVRGIMNRLPEKTDVLAEGPRAIMNSIGTQLNINNIRDIGTRSFKLQRAPQGLNLLLDYEVRKPLVFNIDVVMKFDHEVMLPTP
jgi:hypothetical protein